MKQYHTKKELRKIREKGDTLRLLQELFVSKLEEDIRSIRYHDDLDTITRWDFNQYDDHMHIIRVAELIQRVINDEEYTQEEIKNELNY